MDDIFSGIRGIDSDSTAEVPAKDKTDFFWIIVLANWIVVASVALMLWGRR